jgi:acetolactate synthase-1/3 small subunit
MMLHTFAVYVEDKPGVLNRISSLFRRRAFNIDSLTVGHTETAGVSRMTIVCDADETSARRIEANVYKLVNVLRVDDLSHLSSIDRELAMVKVSATSDNRAQIMQRDDGHRGEDRPAARRAATLRRPRDGAHGTRGDGARRPPCPLGPRSVRRRGRGRGHDGVLFGLTKAQG